MKVNKLIRVHFVTMEPIGYDANHYVFRFKDTIIQKFNELMATYSKDMKDYVRLQDTLKFN